MKTLATKTRTALAGFAALMLFATPALAVGFQQLTVPDPGSQPLEVGIWYPSNSLTAPQPLELFTQDVAEDGTIEGRRLPLIVMSHGTGGGFAGHYDTALALANAGFVVASVTHTGDNYRDLSDQAKRDTFINRTRHVRQVLDYMLAAWPGHERIDAERVGMFGFSAGGFTTLIAIGGVPDLAKVQPFCAAHPDDWGCRLVKSRGIDLATAALPPASAWVHDARIKAAVVVAPALGYTFNGGGLAQVSVPIQLWRGAIDPILPHPNYAQVVYDELKTKPDYRVVPNAGHFSFLAPCSEALAKVASQICPDAPGFDRAAFHQEFDAAVVAFFEAKLPAE